LIPVVVVVSLLLATITGPFSGGTSVVTSRLLRAVGDAIVVVIVRLAVVVLQILALVELVPGITILVLVVITLALVIGLGIVSAVTASRAKLTRALCLVNAGLAITGPIFIKLPAIARRVISGISNGLRLLVKLFVIGRELLIDQLLLLQFLAHRCLGVANRFVVAELVVVHVLGFLDVLFSIRSIVTTQKYPAFGLFDTLDVAVLAGSTRIVNRGIGSGGTIPIHISRVHTRPRQNGTVWSPEQNGRCFRSAQRGHFLQADDDATRNQAAFLMRNGA